MNYYVSQLSDKGTVAVDDMILVKGAVDTAGSRILEGFKPLFSAEAVVRLENNGYEISGKTHVGEFSLDLVGEFSHYAPQEGRLAGAAASLVADGAVRAALGVDMNGTPRRAAAQAGVAFLKPTYGTVSRYGVISCAASGEQLGVYAKDSAGISEIMSIIAGHDDKDGTSLPEASYNYDINKPVEGRRAAIIKELFDRADSTVQAKLTAYAEALRSQGVSVETISCDIFDRANTAWQILMCAETCNNVSRYDGVKFGYRAEQYRTIDDLYVNSRTEGLNFLTKAVILYGSDVLSKNRYKDCYDKSLRIRRVTVNALAQLLEQYDALLMPACGTEAYEAYDIKDAFGKVFAESVYTAAASITGLPALVSGGVQLVGDRFAESVLLSLAHSVEGKGE